MITIRPARAGDRAFLLVLRNDPATYRYFRAPRPVTPDEHRRWFDSVLRDGSRTLYMIEREGMPVGQVRFDAHADSACAEVSVSIAAPARGSGAGTLAVRRAMIRYLAEHPAITTITAEIHAENGASFRLFDRFGFRPTGRDGAFHAFALECPRERLASIIAVLQVRASSTRLPGKVLKPILGEPMLARQIERILRSKRIDQLVVATSTDASDDAIAALCAQWSIARSRGSLADVLDRVYQAVAPYAPTHVVRLTGDCPLTDPAVIDAAIDFALRGDFDYATNVKPYTFPDGLDVEVVTFRALETAWREAELPSHREHVLPFIHRQPERFYLGYYRSPVDLSRHRWTVDESEDFVFVTAVYEALYPTNPNFSMRDILDFLEHHPELLRVNERFERNAGRRKAFEEDAKFLVSQRAPMPEAPVCPAP